MSEPIDPKHAAEDTAAAAAQRYRSAGARGAGIAVGAAVGAAHQVRHRRKSASALRFVATGLIVVAVLVGLLVLMVYKG